MADTNSREVRVLTLEEHADYETTLFRFQKGVTLRFKLSPILQALNVNIRCNHPSGGSWTLFEKDRFHQLDWTSDSHCWYDDSERYCDVEISCAGAFQFIVEYRKYEKGGSELVTKIGYFLVDPTLRLTKTTTLPLDCVACLTLLSKNLGVLTGWKQKLQVAKEAGYNMIHFTPVQQLGESQSAYSISNQLKSNPNFHASKVRPKSTKLVKTSSHLGDMGHVIEMEEGLKKIGDLTESIRNEWGILSITDVVWNHMAVDSDLLKVHPEAAYNLMNSPHLRPAFALDQLLYQFSLDMAARKFTSEGVTPHIRSESELHHVMHVLNDIAIVKGRLWEYFTVDVGQLLKEFRIAISEHAEIIDSEDRDRLTLQIIQDPLYRRHKSTIDMKVAMKMFNITKQCGSEKSRIEMCCFDFKQALDNLNYSMRYGIVKDHINSAVHNVMMNVKYTFLESHGPRRGKVTEDEPLVPRYFSNLAGAALLTNTEIESDAGRMVVAHNGWVMDADPLVNFANPGSTVYLRRELIVWGDSCKLNYEEKRDDSLWLWEQMEEYTRVTARLFHGFRLDNCHNTPIHVAEHLLNVARQMRPDLYVVAELFTNSEAKDNIFVNRLGINSMVREAMSAWDSQELGRLVYRYGGEPVGSFIHPHTIPVSPNVAHAIFVDATHDNKSQMEVRTACNVLPNSALVAMACCASGSTAGYDSLVPHHVNVVTEKREFPSWSDSSSLSAMSSVVTVDDGIIAGKKALNDLHYQLGIDGYNQVFVDQVTDHVIAVTRHRPSTHESVILVAHTVFWHPPEDHLLTETSRGYTPYIPPLCVQGKVEEVIFEAMLMKLNNDKLQYKIDTNYINGLKSHRLILKNHISVSESTVCDMVTGSSDSSADDYQEIKFKHFPPGTVVAFKVRLFGAAEQAIITLRSQLILPMPISSIKVDHTTMWFGPQFDALLSCLSLADLNYILYKSQPEENEDGSGGVYTLQNGPLPYAGIQGVMSILSVVHHDNDQGHPICDNLRSGNWLFEYVSNRLKLQKHSRELGEHLEMMFDQLKTLPRYLIPSYFSAILTAVHVKLLKRAWNAMSMFVSDGSSLIKQLALGSIQLCGHVSSSPLPPLAPSLMVGREDSVLCTMAAGFPHFTTGVMRCWGRDTFISLRGLLLVTGRYREARDLILAFAGSLRHGLIPNLLAGGTNARYNCRDAVWWWLQSIKDYCMIVPHGLSLLSDLVSRLFPDDDSEPQEQGKVEMPLCAIIQEALQRHASGISFRERGAGPHLDHNMHPNGFNVEAGVNFTTGFIYGGSIHNCGTWMDKVGESDRAGNKGVPATPRDGSAVELVGLCKSVVHWLSELNNKGVYKNKGVMVQFGNKSPRLFTWLQWDKLIEESFERHFWIPLDEVESSHIEHAHLIHRRGIYRDSVGASQQFADFQLRPNFPIAMVVAPELFDPEHAWKALNVVEENLLGKLGMATLDPKDWAYDGVYDNGQDSTNRKNARGFNYHQGPEWLWVTGYFLRAKLHFAKISSYSTHFDETVAMVKRVLSAHREAIQSSPYKGLVELTNAGGVECKDSCVVQAWSMACTLDVLYDLAHTKTV
ncbi:glycogen debranching enzyme-like [Corticium candelabrum]|uniref:glycogen debranching enzyme-like n=1 Tax=Corticium candelabrum TaxID=121492 RepID=UPI002E2714B6|nr:glycogen debranching enzyme-like [Corticium candelabrum]